MAVSGGPDKVPAIRAALRGGLIDVLVTDSVTAEKLLEAVDLDDSAWRWPMADAAILERDGSSCRGGGRGRPGPAARASCRAPCACCSSARATSSSPGRARRTPWRCASRTCSPAAGRRPSSCTPGTASTARPGPCVAGDVWIGLSKGGETAEVCFLAGIARKRGATVIAITEKPDSTLGRLADVVLEVHAPADVDPYGMIATGSSLFNSAFCDAICVALLELRGYTREAFGETHPGGAVGHRLRGEEAS